MPLKNIFLYLFVLILGLSISSCHTDTYHKQLEQIDSLMSVIDSADIRLNSLDTSVVQSYYNIYTQNINRIRENFDKKNDDEVWSVITRYGLLRKPLRDFKKHYTNYSKEIEFSRLQLINLRTDIKNNILTEAIIEQYITEESEFVNYINLSVSGLMETTTNYFNQYLELNPKVEKFIIENKI